MLQDDLVATSQAGFIMCDEQLHFTTPGNMNSRQM
jgi:hypothetical protein